MKSKFLWLLFVMTPLVLAQPQQSANFRITKSVLDAGGQAGTSANFKLVSAFGQPSPLGLASSTHFSLSGGFLSPALTVSPLSPIQDVVITYAAPDAQLNWSPSPGAHSYKIYRSTEAMFAPDISNFVSIAADTFFTDFNVLSLQDVRYYYNVTASNDLPALLAKSSHQQTVRQSFTPPTAIHHPDAAAGDAPTPAKKRMQK